MSLSSRLVSARRVRQARALGLEVGTGLGPLGGPPVTVLDPGAECAKCHVEGRIDLVDAVGGVAYLQCPSCGKEWETRRLGAVLRHR